MAFRIGQKVVCVNALPRPGKIFKDGSKLTKGAVYTIAGSGFLTHLGAPGVSLVEITRPFVPGFREDRFRPLIERKTDISFAHEILRNTKAPVKV